MSMPINPSIALGVQPLQLADPLAQYGKIAAIQQAQNQNALAQYQLGAAQREEAAQNALSAAYKTAYNPETGEYDINRLRGAVIGAGAGARLPGIEKTMGELRTQRLTQEKTEGEIAKQKSDRAANRMNYYRDLFPMVNDRSSAAALQTAMYQDPDFADLPMRQIPLEQLISQIPDPQTNPDAFNQWKQRGVLGAAKFIELNKPQLITSNLGKTTETTAFSPLTGQINKVLTQTNTIAPADAERIRLDGQRIGLEGRRVAVMEENQRRDADPAFQQRMANARATGEAIAKGDVAAQQSLPKVITRAEEGLRLIDELVGKQEVRDKNGKVIQAATKPHPGFQNAVGATWLPGARFVPGTDAASFMARFDQIKGASFLEAFEALKGGGAITEKEGTKGTDAINRMSIATDEKEFMSAARDLQDVIRKGVANAQRRAAGMGAAPAASPAAGAGVDTSNPLLK